MALSGTIDVDATKSRTVDSGIITTCTGPRLPCIVTLSRSFSGTRGRSSDDVTARHPYEIRFDTVFRRKQKEKKKSPEFDESAVREAESCTRALTARLKMRPSRSCHNQKGRNVNKQGHNERKAKVD
ncbi:uncharacterized protein G2W53_027636 [Senna tora]|uniref:Uncharacterized protein n=1 Tax=Senna tora TaxID=362788 RepID=A0A834TJE0_9FABA|nr:uncharacterized protein G2W53_027636 [Senna tora]